MQLIALPCYGLFSVRKLELNVYDYYHENWMMTMIIIIIIQFTFICIPTQQSKGQLQCESYHLEVIINSSSSNTEWIFFILKKINVFTKMA